MGGVGDSLDLVEREMGTVWKWGRLKQGQSGVGQGNGGNGDSLDLRVEMGTVPISGNGDSPDLGKWGQSRSRGNGDSPDLVEMGTVRKWGGVGDSLDLGGVGDSLDLVEREMGTVWKWGRLKQGQSGVGQGNGGNGDSLGGNAGNGDSLDLRVEMGTVPISWKWGQSGNGGDSNRDSLELGKERGGESPLFGRGYTAAEGAFSVPVIARWPPGDYQRPSGSVEHPGLRVLRNKFPVARI